MTAVHRGTLSVSRSADDIGQGGLLAVIILYLVLALVLPVSMVVYKSLQTYSFTLDQVEIEFNRDGQWGERQTLQAWVDRSGYVINDGIRPSERTRIQPARIIPKSARKGVEQFRVRDLSDASGLILLGGKLSADSEWISLERKQFGKLQIRPASRLSLGNYGYYFSTPALRNSIRNSLFIALLTTAIVVPLAFAYAYGLTRTRLRWNGFFRLSAMVPILVPSLLPAIGLVYLFGKQGILTPLLLGNSIYGPIGIVLASVFFTFPHALLIMLVALSTADARLYEAAAALGASHRRTFTTVTLPGVRYGLISAGFVVFTLVVTDFGVPKVIGGQYNVLALDIYKQVIGQQNFQIGAVVSMVLLVPAVIAFIVDRTIARRQVAALSAKAVPYTPKVNPFRDRFFLGVCSLICVFLLGILLMCQLAALFKFWPYNLSVGLQHFEFGRMDGGGWASYTNSIQLALMAATIGVALVFLGAFIVEKARHFQSTRTLLQFLAMMPMAIPGMVLGLAYIFFFNDVSNPLNFLYGTMAILVINTVTHLYTVPHLTASTALKQLDNEFESVSMSLRQPFWRGLFQVTAPICLPAIAEIWLYLFVTAMTTVSAVVFLYSPNTTLASIAVLNMDDAGDIAPAAAMCMMIFYTNVAVRLGYAGISRRYLANVQTWRRASA